MSVFEQESKILITCSKEIPRHVASELKELGYPILDELIAGVVTKGTMTDCIHMNLNIRTGHRVLYHIADFKIYNADELYKKIKTIKWEELFDVDGYICVTSSVVNDTIRDTRFANLRCKDAIVDRFMEKYNRRPDSGPDNTEGVVFIHWKDDKASIYVDTTGVSLNRRTYRKYPHKAPMIESLAAAVIRDTEWKGETALVNPMCGSGTLAIEAALIALNRAPGLMRDNYGFMYVNGYSEEVYESARIKAEGRQKYKIEGKIYASDIDPKAVDAARTNAKAAMVEKYIEFAVCDFREAKLPSKKKGIVIMNPEYGVRLGDEQALEPTYKAMGDFFKQDCKGYMCYIFTGNLNLAKKVGLATKRKIPYWNSKIECRLLSYDIYEGSKK